MQFKIRSTNEEKPKKKKKKNKTKPGHGHDSVGIGLGRLERVNMERVGPPSQTISINTHVI